MKSIVLATRNAGKLKEISGLFAGCDYRFISLRDLPRIPEVPENGSSFEENALIKAREIFRVMQLPALADDSGLEVEALGNRPGIFSARYAGENVSYAANNKKLLEELKGLPPEKRHAHFRCVAAFVAPGVEYVTEGICPGMIIDSPRGTGGFGYDPLFVPDGYQNTFAELSLDIKNSISHRSRAFRLMADYLKKYLEKPEELLNSQ